MNIKIAVLLVTLSFTQTHTASTTFFRRILNAGQQGMSDGFLIGAVAGFTGQATYEIQDRIIFEKKFSVLYKVITSTSFWALLCAVLTCLYLLHYQLDQHYL